MRYYVYFLWNQEQYFINITHRPALDWAYRGGQAVNRMALLTGPLPIGLAGYILEQIASAQEITGQKWRRSKTLFKGKFASFVADLLGNRRQGERLDCIDAMEYPKVLREKFTKVKRILSAMTRGDKPLVSRETIVGQPNFFPWDSTQTDFLQGQAALDFWKAEGCRETLAKALAILDGRLLLPREVATALKEHELTLPQDQEDLLQIFYLEGLVKLFSAVGLDQAGQPICFRCGQRSGVREIECLDCGDRCFYCEECLNMGEARFCLPLYGFQGTGTVQVTGARDQGTGISLAPDPRSLIPDEGSLNPDEGTSLHLNFQLTPAQADASREAKDFVTGSQSQALIWAVCGAGKTEVAFAAIDEVLRAGDRVLFAIPRRDVVMELEPRLRKAFPREKIACLYGGSSGKFQEARVVIATTHQVIRFYQAFDLVVLDEVDAFPYAGSTMLYNAVERAKKPAGKLIYMTATPSFELVQKAKKGEIALIRIPARHHGYPLPEPLITLGQGISSKGGRVCLPQAVLDFLKVNTREQGAQVFVFVPNINLAPLVAGEIAKALEVHGNGDLLIQWSHARDPERDSKREAFSRGQIKIFITTSIMERGITVPRAHVLVLFADQERIFDQGTLVQMAGRAGRSTAFPQGNVCFIGYRKTKSMISACRAIREMNQEAAKRGYLLKKS